MSEKRHIWIDLAPPARLYVGAASGNRIKPQTDWLFQEPEFPPWYTWPELLVCEEEKKWVGITCYVPPMWIGLARFITQEMDPNVVRLWVPGERGISEFHSHPELGWLDICWSLVSPTKTCFLLNSESCWYYRKRQSELTLPD